MLAMLGKSNLALIALLFAFHSLRGVVNFDPSILRDPTGYKLRPGDVVSISVLGEPECSIEAKISDDERVRLVYIGEVPIAKLSAKQAEKFIAEEYRRRLIFREAKVLVRITKYVERSVFLAGAVSRKGVYVFPPEVEAMNIVQVIARSGGFTDIANKKNVRVTRTFYDDSGKIKDSKTYEINVEDLSSGVSNTGANRTFMIYPGDQIFVKERLV